MPAYPGTRPPGGSRKGRPNKTTKTLRETILLAAELEGKDGKGTDGLVGYLRRVASEDVKAFASLLGRVLPLQVAGDGGGPLEVRRVEFVDAPFPHSHPALLADDRRGHEAR